MKLRKFSFVLIGLLVVVFILMLFLTSCNKTIFDTSYKFDYAYVKLGDQTIAEGKGFRYGAGKDKWSCLLYTWK